MGNLIDKSTIADLSSKESALQFSSEISTAIEKAQGKLSADLCYCILSYYAHGIMIDIHNIEAVRAAPVNERGH